MCFLLPAYTILLLFRDNFVTDVVHREVDSTLRRERYPCALLEHQPMTCEVWKSSLQYCKRRRSNYKGRERTWLGCMKGLYLKVDISCRLNEEWDMVAGIEKAVAIDWCCKTHKNLLHSLSFALYPSPTRQHYTYF